MDDTLSNFEYDDEYGFDDDELDAMNGIYEEEVVDDRTFIIRKNKITSIVEKQEDLMVVL